MHRQHACRAVGLLGCLLVAAQLLQPVTTASAQFDVMQLVDPGQCAFPDAADMSSVTNAVFVACDRSNLVKVLNGATTPVIPCGGNQVFSSPSLDLVYASCGYSNMTVTAVWNASSSNPVSQVILNSSSCPKLRHFSVRFNSSSGKDTIYAVCYAGSSAAVSLALDTQTRVVSSVVALAPSSACSTPEDTRWSNTLNALLISCLGSSAVLQWSGAGAGSYITYDVSSWCTNPYTFSPDATMLTCYNSDSFVSRVTPTSPIGVFQVTYVAATLSTSRTRVIANDLCPYPMAVAMTTTNFFIACSPQFAPTLPVIFAVSVASLAATNITDSSTVRPRILCSLRYTSDDACARCNLLFRTYRSSRSIVHAPI